MAGQKTKKEILEAARDVLKNPSMREALSHANGQINASRLWIIIKRGHPEINIGSERGRKILSELIQEKI
jgi:hypothetical protein